MGSKSAIGIGNGICFKQVRDKGGGSYIDPLVRDSIVGLWKFDQNTNESLTRNIIKNTIKDKGGDLELLNFGYKLNSGYNGYIEDFSLFVLSNRFKYSEISSTKVTITAILDNSTGIYHSVTEKDSALYWNTFKIKVSGSTDDVHINYVTNSKIIRLYNGINTVVVPNDLSWHSFTASATNVSCNITLTFVPDYEGALVTDGKDDMIVSQKTVQEMLGGSNEITVVSMIHQIGGVATNTNLFTNCIQYNTGSKGHNIVNYQNSLGKTGIYGYSRANVSIANNEVVINNILGDKEDYLTNVSIGALTSNEKFSVVGYLDVSPQQVTSVAVYWTFISNKVLTTDEINQIIGYFKLDNYVTPQVIYDVKRQGLSNDTPDSDWYLKDFSGNGHDMQLYNFAKKLGSGISKYKEDFTTWKISRTGIVSTINVSSIHVTRIGTSIDERLAFFENTTTTNKKFNIKLKISGLTSDMKCTLNNQYSIIKELVNGVNEISVDLAIGWYGFTIIKLDGSIIGDCDITITQIPDYEGALVSDGKDDYGKAEGLPILKDYTVVVDRAWTNDLVKYQCLTSKLNGDNFGSFSFELIENGFSSYSFGTSNKGIITIDSNKKINYQSKYVYNSSPIISGNNVDGKDLFLFRNRDSYPYYAEAAIWSYILFPYSLSEFLLERQLKKYKLGTLYPDMVEFRPIINVNIGKTYNVFEIRRTDTNELLYYYINGSVPNNMIGTYLPKGTNIRILVKWDNNRVDVTQIKFNGKEYELNRNSNDNYYINVTLDKSPQKIDIYADEYIRYEDIVQPYPAIINLKQDGKTITWGDKLKVGSDIVFVGSANLLPELYTVSETRYNGVTLYPNTIIKVERSMVFDNARTYLKANEPSCILSPNRLRIPNSSYKILGYIPDLTGKGNHGRLNNFAYTEESGANEDGSIRFDGKDDYIIISTLAHGGECMLMKVNWNKDDVMLYDQRGNNNLNRFAIYIPNFNNDNESPIAYNSRNDGKTYIDGVLNTSVKGSQLKDVTHNITITNSNSNNNNTVSPVIGTNAKHNAFYAQMVLFDFMLFPEISSEDEIKKLNNVMGIEGGYVESPNYYQDAYDKKNADTDRNLIADQVSKDVANALEVKNVAYNSESGYTDDNGLLLDGVEDKAVNTVIPAVTDFTVIGKRNILNYENVFAVKGGNTTSAAAFVLEYGSDKFYNFGGVNTVEYPNTITVATKSSYNNNPAVSSQGIDSLGLRIGEYRNYYSKLVFYKLMLYTKTIDQLSINMLKNLFERDELIDITNPIFKKKEL